MLEPQHRCTLFVAGRTLHSLVARSNIERALKLLGRSDSCMTIVDVNERPDLASSYRILVTPTLVREGAPEMRITGDLSAAADLCQFLQ